eukprot:2409177-Pleurochrysis_carterae.AAC.1
MHVSEKWMHVSEKWMHVSETRAQAFRSHPSVLGTKMTRLNWRGEPSVSIALENDGIFTVLEEETKRCRALCLRMKIRARTLRVKLGRGWERQGGTSGRFWLERGVAVATRCCTPTTKVAALA